MDPQSEADASLVAQVRVMQIIVGALVMGVVMFAGIASFISFNNDKQQVELRNNPLKKGLSDPDAGAVNPAAEAAPDSPNQFPVFAYLGAGLAGLMIVLRLIVPRILVQIGVRDAFREQLIENVSKEQFVPIYQTSLIIASALLEGAALFNCIALIVQGQIWSLGIVGGLVLLMAAGFPTVDRVDAWTEEQLRNWQLNPNRE